MNLEDHLGDIIRKGCKSANVSPADAAKAAGLTEAELAAIEESGKVIKKPNFGPLAALIGLHPGKLEGIANGWLPSEKDLGQWRELRRIQTEQGGNVVNCYVIWDEVSREAAVFDTGWTGEPVVAFLEENKLQLRHIFLTQTHEDHTAVLPSTLENVPRP